MRESTVRTWKRHRLDMDVRANREAWARNGPRYADNPHYPDRARWEHGLGLYGQISTRSWNWDPMAPPEVLCRVVEGTETYLRIARRAWRKLRNGVDCDRDGVREWHGSSDDGPTWYDIHEAASRGKLCAKPRGFHRFVQRARNVDLDPLRPVELVELGQPIPRLTQNERADELRRRIEQN